MCRLYVSHSARKPDGYVNWRQLKKSGFSAGPCTFYCRSRCTSFVTNGITARVLLVYCRQTVSIGGGLLPLSASRGVFVGLFGPPCGAILEEENLETASRHAWPSASSAQQTDLRQRPSTLPNGLHHSSETTKPLLTGALELEK
jgi:hypothetical protein